MIIWSNLFIINMREEINQNDLNNQFKIVNFSISLLPIITIAVIFVTITINYILYCIQGRFSINSLPTFSETAMFYPMSKIFAVGVSAFAFLFFFDSEIFCDCMSLNNYSKSKFMRFLPPIVSILFTITCCVNKSEHPNIHGCFSCVSFFTLLIFAIWTFCALKKQNILRFKLLRLSLIIVGIISTIGIILTAPFTKLHYISIIQAVIEYAMVLSLLIFFGLWFSDFKRIDIDFCVVRTVIEEPLNP